MTPTDSTPAQSASIFDQRGQYVQTQNNVGSVAIMLGEDLYPAPGECPFKGLDYFNEADADLFFGRERLTAQLVAHLREHNFLAIIGASGSGKSSLVRAGVVATLELKGWQCRITIPSAQPLGHLIEKLRKDNKTLLEHANNPLPEQSGSTLSNHFLLVVDQFEELFTLTSKENEEERKLFIDNLLESAEVINSPATPSPVKVIICLRADFYAACSPYSNLRIALERYQQYIGSMTTNELRAAIEQPAIKKGWAFESGLVDLLLDDVGQEPGGLPLLSHALLETWKRRNGHTLTLAGYQASGRVAKAIATTAERVYNDLLNTKTERDLVRNIFLRLTEFNEEVQDTRRRVKRSELLSITTDSDTTMSVLKILSDERLITIEEHEIEVAHEALIREWPRLRGWLADNRQELYIHRKLVDATNDWLNHQKDPSYLYQGTRLAQIQEWLGHPNASLNTMEQEFIATSVLAETGRRRREEAARQRELDHQRRLAEEQRQRANEQAKATKRFRRFTVALIVTLIFTLIAFVFANTQRVEGVVRELKLETQNLIQKGNLNVATLLALETKRFDSNVGDDLLQQIPLETTFVAAIGLQAHKGAIRGLAWSPDGRMIATGAENGKIILWNAENGEIVRTLYDYPEDILCITWSQNGRKLAVGRASGATIWSLETFDQIFAITGVVGGIWGLSWNPAETIIAGVGSGETGIVNSGVMLWNTTTGKYLGGLYGTSGGQPAMSVAWSLDGQTLTSGTREGKILRWNLAKGGMVYSVNDSSNIVARVAWSPDGLILASVSYDGLINLRESNGALIRSIQGANASINDFVWGFDGETIITGESNGTIHFWNAENGMLENTLQGHSGAVFTLAWDPNNYRLASGSDDGSVILWDLTRKAKIERLKSHSRSVWSLAWSRDSKILASGGEDAQIVFWDRSNDEPLRLIDSGFDYIVTMAWSPDNRTLVAGGKGGLALWDTTTGRIVHNFNQDETSITSVAWNPKRQIIASAASDRISLWNSTTGELLDTYYAATNKGGGISFVYALAWSPNGHTLAYNAEERVYLRDIDTGKLDVFENHKESVLAIAWSLDGSILATAGKDADIVLWEVNSGAILHTLKGHTKWIRDLAWSPDGLTLASGAEDEKIIFWDVHTWTRRHAVGRYIGGIYALSWIPDGQILAAAGWDHTVYRLPKIFTQAPCQWVSFNFNIKQWTKFLPGEIYAPTCSTLPASLIPGIAESFNSDLDLLFVSWEGRIFIFSLLIVPILAIVGLLLRIFTTGSNVLSKYGWYTLLHEGEQQPLYYSISDADMTLYVTRLQS